MITFILFVRIIYTSSIDLLILSVNKKKMCILVTIISYMSHEWMFYANIRCVRRNEKVLFLFSHTKSV